MRSNLLLLIIKRSVWLNTDKHRRSLARPLTHSISLLDEADLQRADPSNSLQHVPSLEGCAEICCRNKTLPVVRHIAALSARLSAFLGIVGSGHCGGCDVSNDDPLSKILQTVVYSCRYTDFHLLSVMNHLLRTTACCPQRCF